MKDRDVLVAIDNEDIVGTGIGIIFMVLMGWLPLLGPIVSGFISGTTVRGARGGLKIGLFVGAIGSFLTNFILDPIFDSITITITPNNSFGAVMSHLLNASQSLNPVILMFIAIVFAAIGGAIGGAFTNRIATEGYRKGRDLERESKMIRQRK